MKPIILKKDLFPSLIEKLLCLKPVTYKIVGNLLAALDGKRTVKCYVDNWPEGFTTAVVEITFPVLVEDSFSVHTSDTGKLRDMIVSNPDVFDWSKKIMFGGVLSEVADVIQDLATKENVSIERKGPYLIMESLEKSPPGHSCELPSGYTFGKLEEENADLVASQWRYTEKGTDDFIRFILKHFNSVSLIDPDGEIVGWYMEQPYGAQGMLQVLPSQRGKGLGKCLVRRLRDQLLDAGKPSYIYTRTDNEASIQLHSKCGFQRTSDVISWLIITPKK